MGSRKIKKQLAVIVSAAREYGLNTTNVNHAQDFLNYNEYELCLDIIVTQLYEYSIPVDQQFYNNVEVVAAAMETTFADVFLFAGADKKELEYSEIHGF